jgi:hypothetical protein
VGSPTLTTILLYNKRKQNTTYGSSTVNSSNSIFLYLEIIFFNIGLFQAPYISIVLPNSNTTFVFVVFTILMLINSHFDNTSDLIIIIIIIIIIIVFFCVHTSLRILRKCHDNKNLPSVFFSVLWYWTNCHIRHILSTSEPPPPSPSSSCNLDITALHPLKMCKEPTKMIINFSWMKTTLAAHGNLPTVSPSSVEERS